MDTSPVQIGLSQDRTAVLIQLGGCLERLTPEQARDLAQAIAEYAADISRERPPTADPPKRMHFYDIRRDGDHVRILEHRQGNAVPLQGGERFLSSSYPIPPQSLLRWAIAWAREHGFDLAMLEVWHEDGSGKMLAPAREPR